MPIEHPTLTGNKNMDIWEFAEEQKKTLDLYGIRLRKLREWREKNKEEGD